MTSRSKRTCRTSLSSSTSMTAMRRLLAAAMGRSPPPDSFQSSYAIHERARLPHRDCWELIPPRHRLCAGDRVLLRGIDDMGAMNECTDDGDLEIYLARTGGANDAGDADRGAGPQRADAA